MNKINTTQKRKKGYSLIEMVVVVTIIGLLTAIALPNFLPSTSKIKKNTHLAERLHIEAQLQLYKFKHNDYPIENNSNLNTWTEGTTLYFPEGVPATCNQKVGKNQVYWVINNGKVDLSTHPSHE